jgi:hypothetical protein
LELSNDKQQHEHKLDVNSNSTLNSNSNSIFACFYIPTKAITSEQIPMDPNEKLLLATKQMQHIIKNLFDLYN